MHVPQVRVQRKYFCSKKNWDVLQERTRESFARNSYFDSTTSSRHGTNDQEILYVFPTTTTAFFGFKAFDLVCGALDLRNAIFCLI